MTGHHAFPFRLCLQLSIGLPLGDTKARPKLLMCSSPNVGYRAVKRVSVFQTAQRGSNCHGRFLPRFHPTLNTGPDELSEKLNFSRAEGQRKLMPQGTQPIDSRISAVCPLHQDARKGQLRRPAAVRVQLTLSNLSVFPATSIVLADVNTPRPRKMCFTKSRE